MIPGISFCAPARKPFENGWHQAGGTALLGVLQMERRLRAFEKDITERKLHTDGLAHR